ncbi:unnamed protein product [Effrenium voratum]|nr:unnamed protein product [Effrenium voratum]
MTASLDELKQALIETLETRGVLGQVKAKVRAEIFAALDDEQVQRPQLPRENALINELIREYLEYNGYYHSLSVLLPETGHPEEPQFDRRFLASERFSAQKSHTSVRRLRLFGGATVWQLRAVATRTIWVCVELRGPQILGIFLLPKKGTRLLN